MNAPAELDTLENRLQIFYCLHQTSCFPNQPDSSPRAKNALKFFWNFGPQSRQCMTVRPQSYKRKYQVAFLKTMALPPNILIKPKKSDRDVHSLGILL